MFSFFEIAQVYVLIGVSVTSFFMMMGLNSKASCLLLGIGWPISVGVGLCVGVVFAVVGLFVAFVCILHEILVFFQRWTTEVGEKWDQKKQSGQE